ncbi:UNVERIFIED_CONTAM: hypothetical protein RMT77_005185 [Armadillidium vulgare]
MKVIVLVLFCVLAFASGNLSFDVKENSLPKNEEDPSKKADVPTGLHVKKAENEPTLSLGNTYQLGLASGLTSVESHESNEEGSQVKQKELSREEILRALKDIKNEDPKLDKETRSKKRFRSYQKLKEELEELQIKVESDSQTLKRLISEFPTADDVVRKNIVEDLDYLSHQIDNAVDFVTMDGVKMVIKPGLNSSNEEIRKGVMQLIGSSSQSNPKVQIAMLEEGVLSELLRVIARERDTLISSKAVFAVSCIVRGFPYGQQKLISSGGLDTLREVFVKNDWHSINLKIKVVNLIYDLLEERSNADEERAKQFSERDLVKELVEGEWCSAIGSLLEGASFHKRGRKEDLAAALSKEVPLRPDHDMVEKVVNTMSLLAPSCQDTFSPLLPLLRSLKDTYSDLAFKEKHQGEDGYEYFQSMATHIHSLLAKILVKSEL